MAPKTRVGSTFMTQELIDLRTSILEGRYKDALAIVDELEEMSKQAILRNIQSFLLRMLIHLIKNKVEQRLTNSWAASIRGSVIEIKKLNIKANKKSYYIQQDEWGLMLEDELEEAIYGASVEVMNGVYSPLKLGEMVKKKEIINIATRLLLLTYENEFKDKINEELSELPGGENWLTGK